MLDTRGVPLYAHTTVTDGFRFMSTTHRSSMSLAIAPMRSSREAPPPPPVLGCMDRTIEKLISVSAIAQVMFAFSCMPNTFWRQGEEHGDR